MRNTHGLWTWLKALYDCFHTIHIVCVILNQYEEQKKLEKFEIGAKCNFTLIPTSILFASYYLKTSQLNSEVHSLLDPEFLFKGRTCF